MTDAPKQSPDRDNTPADAVRVAHQPAPIVISTQKGGPDHCSEHGDIPRDMSMQTHRIVAHPREKFYWLPDDGPVGYTTAKPEPDPDLRAMTRAISALRESGMWPDDGYWQDAVYHGNDHAEDDVAKQLVDAYRAALASPAITAPKEEDDDTLAWRRDIAKMRAHLASLASPAPSEDEWRCDWQPDDLNPAEDGCPYCAGRQCGRFDGLGCTHDRIERHGYDSEDRA